MHPHLLAASLGGVSLLLAGPAAAAGLGLEGVWRADDGTALVRIAPCGAGVLCATVLEDRPAPGEASAVGKVVVRDLRASAKGWKGAYSDGKATLPATVRQLNDRAVEFRACMGPICDSVRYSRVGRP
ncbi:MAG: hypothetical protein KA098_01990 [Phenylobacterium sp.]|nr:hypothetical protein [Phenylobacterium sp.]